MADGLQTRWVSTVVFLCGNVLMVMEIAGSRVLAPFFGGTIFVWASLISVFLAALALGYFGGGWLSDRYPSRPFLAGIIGIAGILVILIPYIGKITGSFLLDASLGEPAGSLIASMMIFFIPSILLGMVSPFAVKFCVRDMSTVGHTTGRLYAFSALGNICGTLLTAFLLINIISVSSIFLLAGFLLMAIALFIFAADKRRGYCILFGIFFGLAMEVSAQEVSVGVPLAPDEMVILQQDSFYNQIEVVEDLRAGIRKLQFDRSYTQTAVSLSGDHDSPFAAADMMHLPVAFVPEIKRALFLGCGGGVTPRRYVADYPGVMVDVVEIDPQVYQVSKEFFFFKDADQIRVYIADGRRFVREAKDRYDIVLLDVFNSAGRVPVHLLTKEFFQELEGVLTPEGVVGMNFISIEGGVNNKLFLALCKTLGKVFKNVYVVPDIFSDPSRDLYGRMNIFIIASRAEEMISQQQLFTHIKSMVDQDKIKIKNFEWYARITHTIIPSILRRLPVMTDDFSPAEFLYLQKRK